MQFVIRGLDKQADTATFDCGQSPLNDYIQRYATQDVRRNIARVFVICPQNDPSQIAGFYTLSAASVQCTELPAQIAKKLPRYPIPVALIGRLAVSNHYQGQGLGSVLLIDACRKVRLAHAMLAVVGIVVDAKDASAEHFYQHFGFTSLDNSLGTKVRRLFLAMQVIDALR
jgi:GNAT superfamily N-acetyltransferase